MQQILIVGVDVSKSTLDICFKPAQTFMQINNTVAGFKQWLSELQKLNEQQDSVLVVMEHTGQYSYRFEKFLQVRQIGYCKIAALQIKRSMGITRGKNDKVDARRIAEYGWLRKQQLKAEAGVEQPLEELRSLLSYRAKLVGDRSGYICRRKEMIAAGTCTASSFEGKHQKQIIDHFTTAILKVEARIKVIVQADPTLWRTCELLKSIKGVGWIIALYMISYTQNFKKFADARKFNCYAGLAPFSHESGTSLRGRSRISHLANKQAKTLLNLAAFSAIRYNEELKNYYQRRIAEGKRKMSCLNIIRSKIVARMFAVIKRQSPYQQQLAA